MSLQELRDWHSKQMSDLWQASLAASNSESPKHKLQSIRMNDRASFHGEATDCLDHAITAANAYAETEVTP